MGGWTRQSRPVEADRLRVTRAWLLAFALAIPGALSYLFYTRHVQLMGGTEKWIHWSVISVIFFVSEAVIIELPFRREKHAYTLTEVGLMLGLFFVAPSSLVLAAIAGKGLALGIRRRQQPLKLFFNLAMASVEVSTAVFIFYALTGTRNPVDPGAWLAALAAAVTAGILGNIAVSIVISVVQGEWDPRFGRVLGLGLLTSTTNACLALVGVALWDVEPRAFALLIVPIGVLFLAYENIVQRARAEQALHQSEARFRALVQNSADAVAIASRTGDITYISSSLDGIVGFSVEEVTTHRGFACTSDEDRERVSEAFDRVLSEDSPIVKFETRATSTDGGERWVEHTLHNLLDDPDVEGVVWNVRDISVKRLAEEEVRRSEGRLQAILDHASTSIYIKDVEGRYVLVNRLVERTLGKTKDQIIGKTSEELFEPEIARPLVESDRRVLETLSPTSVEEIIRRDGEMRTYLSVRFPMLDADGEAYGICGISTDVTEAKKLEERLVQSEKMQAVGQLAGGIAHDFNNLLAVVTNYARFILDDLDEDHPSRADAEEIVRAGETATTLTKQLLAFSRKEIQQPEVLDLNRVIESTHSMLRSMIPSSITIGLELARDAWALKLDPGRIEQVVMNFVINARDALPDGGEITLRTANETIEPSQRERPGLEPGRYVVLTVIDNGMGIPEDVLPHIFEPFFTTKDRNQGTGLGLASVYGIVEEAHGGIFVESTAGSGTCFTVYFPAHDDNATLAPVKAAAAGGGGYTILVAEDEDGVRKIAERILTNGGYNVVVAASGEEALEIATSYPVPFDLLLADVIMPGMSGGELSEQAGLPTLFMSGYTDQMIGARGVLAADVAFLPKPFTAEELLTKVAETIGAQVPVA